MKPLCATCRQNIEVADEIHATIVDYLTDLQTFLNAYFFKKLLVCLVECLVIEVVSGFYNEVI
jgi:hypothetical protein